MTSLCLVIGDPIEHSLSPLLHNAAYAAAGIADRYFFAAARVRSEDLPAAMAGIRALGVRGVSCTLPHKTAVMAFLDEVHSDARRMGAVNTVVNEGGRLKGFNTDAAGVVMPLERRIALAGKRAAVLGAGGAARAAVFGLSQRGAQVSIFNRSAERGAALAADLGVDFRPMERVAEVGSFEIVVNCTSLGMAPKHQATPVAAEYLKAGQLVFDAVYAPYETRLLREARAKGAAVIHGMEMFVAQGAAQFELYTGLPAPVAVMESALKERLEAR